MASGTLLRWLGWWGNSASRVGLAPSRMRCRIGLSFYVHLAEASGFYEIPKNMMRIADGTGHSSIPFADLVDKHKQTGERIAPNANKIHKNLAGHAATLGMPEMAEVFRDAFDPDIRNGYAHADYVVWRDGLRLPKRNGGLPRLIVWADFDALLSRAINFFEILWRIRDEYIQSYNPPKTVTASLQDEPPLEWTIYSDPDSKVFGIKTGQPERQ